LENCYWLFGALLRLSHHAIYGCGGRGPLPMWVKTSNAQNKEMFSGLPRIADMRDGVPDFRLVP
jgi:hypothetical protein